MSYFDRIFFFLWQEILSCDKTKFKKWEKQAGAELGQAQLKLELELCYISFEILSYR